MITCVVIILFFSLSIVWICIWAMSYFSMLQPGFNQYTLHQTPYISTCISSHANRVSSHTKKRSYRNVCFMLSSVCHTKVDWWNDSFARHWLMCWIELIIYRPNRNNNNDKKNRGVNMETSVLWSGPTNAWSKVKTCMTHHFDWLIARDLLEIEIILCY